MAMFWAKPDRSAPREQGLLGGANPKTDHHSARRPGHLEDISQKMISSREDVHLQRVHTSTMSFTLGEVGSCLVGLEDSWDSTKLFSFSLKC